MRLQEFEKVGKLLAKEHKITIEDGEGWKANLKTRQVFYHKNDIYTLSEEHILGMLLHEIAHIHYTQIIEIPKTNGELFGSIWNMLEDISIEHIIGKDYPNAGDILEGTREELLDKLILMLPDLKDVSEFEKALYYAAIRFNGRGYPIGVEEYEKMGIEIGEVMKQERQTILDREFSKDLIPLTNRILEMLIKKFGQPTDQDKMSMRDNTQNMDEDPKTENGRVREKLIDELKAGNGWTKYGVPIAHQVNFIDSIADQAKNLGKKLRTIMKRNNAMEFGGRFRSGKLLAKRLSRIKILKDRHPFSRRIIKSNQSYAFAVASDISGSMFDRQGKNSQGSYALSSLYMVGEALRCAGIPRSMIVFGVNAIVAKKIGKNAITWSDIANDNIFTQANQNGTNIDAAMRECTKELSKIKAEKKIMIILTDGESHQTEMEKQHKIATKEGIECLGITIGKAGRNGRLMDKVFGEKKNRKIVDTKNTSEIGNAFIDILKTTITLSK
jgi:hypothetical protein